MFTMILRLHIFWITLLGMTYSCTTTQKVSVQDESSIFAGTFIVNTLYDQEIGGDDLNLKINDRTSKISGLSGCNTYSVGFTKNKNSITFSQPITTRIMCNEVAMNKERQFLNIFTTTKEFSIKKDTLILYDNGKEILKATRFIF